LSASELPTGNESIGIGGFQQIRATAAHLIIAGLLIAVGSVAGWYLAEWLNRSQMQSELGNAAERTLLRLDAIIDEANLVFAELENSSFEHCSEPLLLEMRTRLFEARFMRDIGGVRGYSLYCSTALGQLETPYHSTPPDMVLADGTGLRTDRSVLASERMRTMVVEKGRFNALIDPRQVSDLTTSIADSDIFISVGQPGPSQWLAFDESARLAADQSGSPLVADRCSQVTGVCVRLTRPGRMTGSISEPTHIVIGSLGGALGFTLFIAGVGMRRNQQLPERELARALRAGDIHARYQPIVNLPDGSLAGFEALARWRLPKGRFVSPESFIALAERSGLISQVSALMIEQIGEDLGEWLSRRPAQRLAINIAPSELSDPALIDHIAEHLIERGVRPGQIILEITERTMLESETSRRHIERLARQGFVIFADDFGVGYCGLAYLNELDMHGIKISQGLTAAVATESPKASLVPRVTEMARELGLEVVIEGVETTEQRTALAALGPVLAQGWLFARDLSAAELKDLYEADTPPLDSRQS